MTRAALVTLLLCGCTGDAWYVHKSFTSTERQSIRHAASAWETATEERIDLEFGADFDVHHPGCKNVISRVHSGDSLLPTNLAMGKHTPSSCNNQIILAYDVIGPDPRRWQGVVMHELGHYFGLRHSRDYRAVMYGYLSEAPPDCITTLDAEAYTAVNGLPADGCPLAE